MADLLPNFPPGPLDRYRKKASFDWKQMKVFLETEDVVKYEQDVCATLQSHPDFQTDGLSPNFDEERRISTRQALAFHSLEILSPFSYLSNLKRACIPSRIMAQVNPSSLVKFSVSKGLPMTVLRSQGTERHDKILEKIESGATLGCFCLTEIGHGSNAKGMRTTATYDKENQQFIMHTPDFEAAKCWAGGLGQISSYAVVYAQLVIDGEQKGLHSFVVQIRDPKTLNPVPGVIVGDMGEKIALNGIDNGFLIFNNYAVPREALLNKNVDVTADGKYVSKYKDARAQHGSTLGALSIGRVNITGICEAYGTKALTIAIRYAAVRKQFGPDDDSEEIPILEYQSHQLRLLPYLAGAFVLRSFNAFFIATNFQFTIDSMLGKKKESMGDLGMEIHVISSGCKPVAGWLMRDGIQECREACGGHGYLKAAGIGEIRNNNDANCTYEGENHILIQQTSNYLVKLWPLIAKGSKISSPLKSTDFLSDGLAILKSKFSAQNLDDICKPQTIIQIYRWLVVYLLRESRLKLDALSGKQGEFWAKNNAQVYYAKNLAIAFIQHYFLQHFLHAVEEATDPKIKAVLTRLFSLYGLWSLEKSMSTFYEGGYTEGPNFSRLIHDAILKLCVEIKDDAVALIDVIAPPDFMLNSVLGASDGQVYHRLESALLRSPFAMARPTWWREVVNWNSNLQGKL